MTDFLQGGASCMSSRSVRPYLTYMNHDQLQLVCLLFAEWPNEGGITVSNYHLAPLIVCLYLILSSSPRNVDVHVGICCSKLGCMLVISCAGRLTALTCGAGVFRSNYA